MRWEGASDNKKQSSGARRLPAYVMWPILFPYKPAEPPVWKFWRLPGYWRSMRRYNLCKRNNGSKALKCIESIADGKEFKIEEYADTGGGKRIKVVFYYEPPS